MKVLLCHNYYQQRGGEDASFEAEASLLEQRGHEVIRHTVHNDAIKGMTPLRVAGRTLWSGQSYRRLRDLMRRERPDVMHCTNTFPLISPAAYHAAHRENVPVVQSLRNYRLACAGATFMRDGAVCEDCLGRTFGWAGVLHGCYRGSRLGSATVATMNAAHWMLGTWTRHVDRYFALTEFARDKYIQAGLPAERIAVKPNFISPDPGPGTGPGQRDPCVLFVGRLSEEKGVDTLLDAWRYHTAPIKLKLAGDGPLMDQVRSAAAADPRIVPLGWRPADEVMHLLGEATCLVMPSVWYETFGRTIVEGFARATPPVVSHLGAMAELVENDRTGLTFTPGDAEDLASKVLRLTQDTTLRARLGHAARDAYTRRYTADANYPMLMSIYRAAIESRGVSKLGRGEPTAAARPQSNPREASS